VGISEPQLETWAQKGKTGQFTDTYKTIRGNLIDGSAPYPAPDVNVFLQGSYGNDTNVWADSDVDIVLKHTGAYYHDLSQLPKDQQARYESENSGTASYGYEEFKAHAEGWIKRLYNGVQVGKKAVYVPGNGGDAMRIFLSVSSFAVTPRTSPATSGITRAWRSTRAASASRTSRSSTPRT
jgi:hypothetical protein